LTNIHTAVVEKMDNWTIGAEKMNAVKVSLIACILAIASTNAEAQIEAEEDQFSLEAILERTEFQNISTVRSVRELHESAVEAVEQGDCAGSYPLLDRLADEANAVANTIRLTIEPYYAARSNDREIDRSLLSELAADEAVANDLLRIRNESWVINAECLADEGDRIQAFALALLALDHISVHDVDLWMRARSIVLAQIEYRQ